MVATPHHPHSLLKLWSTKPPTPTPTIRSLDLRVCQSNEQAMGEQKGQDTRGL